MKKLTVLLAIILAMVIAANAIAQSKPRVAVLKFEEKFDRSWWVTGRLGEKASEMMTTELFKTKKFTVLERARLNDVLKEHNLTASGAVTPQTAVELGKLLGVDLMVMGSVTEFGWDKYTGGFRRIGGTLYNYKSTIDIRVVNVQTAEIMYAESANGTHRGLGVGINSFEAGKESSYDAVAYETFKGAIEKLVDGLGQSASSMSSYQGFGRVASVDGADVYINRGSGDGVKVGDKFDVYRFGKKIIDPDTGQTLGQKKDKVGVIQVVSVDAAKLSTCKILSGEAKQGDMIEN